MLLMQMVDAADTILEPPNDLPPTLMLCVGRDPIVSLSEFTPREALHYLGLVNK